MFNTDECETMETKTKVAEFSQYLKRFGEKCKAKNDENNRKIEYLIYRKIGIIHLRERNQSGRSEEHDSGTLRPDL